MTPEIHSSPRPDLIGWHILRLSDVAEIITGSTPSTSNPQYFVGDHLFITPSDFHDGKNISNTQRHLSEEGVAVSRRIPANSIYTVCIGATVGKTNMCQQEATCNQQINAIVPYADIDPSFLYYAVDYTFNRVKAKYIGQQTLPIVSKSAFSNLVLAIPNTVCQAKIAAILTTQDRVIALKEQLLAQKLEQKKYLMQQLLTGKKRLPGFSGEWSKTKLHHIAKKETRKNSFFEYSLVFSNSAQHGIIPQSVQFDKEIANEDNIDKYYIVENGAFVYNPRISTTAPCGPIHINETGKTGVMSPLYTVFTVISQSCDRYYLKYYFQSACWHAYMKGVANYGARHDRMNVSDSDFLNMPIPMPSLSEQTAIANVLSTADKELALLRQSIEQEKQKKKALMQLLLTGIVRV